MGYPTHKGSEQELHLRNQQKQNRNQTAGLTSNEEDLALSLLFSLGSSDLKHTHTHTLRSQQDQGLPESETGTFAGEGLSQ